MNRSAFDLARGGRDLPVVRRAKGTTAGQAGYVIQSGMTDIFRAGAFGNDNFEVQYKQASTGLWLPAISVNKTTGAVTLPVAPVVTDQSGTRAAISAAQIAAMAAHNVVLNGAIDVSQELGTTGATLVNNTAKYIADQIEAMYNHGAGTAVVTSAQIAAASFGAVLPGFPFGHQIKATTAIAAPANGDFAKHRIKIEGSRIAHWGWGAAGAAAIVIAFQYYSTASGVALVRLSNSAGDRFYYHEITVASGWNFYAFSIVGDASGTWLTTTGIGLVAEVFSSGKETTPGSSLDAWGATAKNQTTNSTNLLGTNNNQTILTGIYIDVGTQLPVAADMPNLMRPSDQETALCQRYFEMISWNLGKAFISQGQSISATLGLYPIFHAPKRAILSAITLSAASDFEMRDGSNNVAGTISALAFSSASSPTVTTVLGTTSGGLANPGSSQLYTALSGAKLKLDVRL